MALINKGGPETQPTSHDQALLESEVSTSMHNPQRQVHSPWGKSSLPAGEWSEGEVVGGLRSALGGSTIECDAETRLWQDQAPSENEKTRAHFSKNKPPFYRRLNFMHVGDPAQVTRDISFSGNDPLVRQPIS